MSWPWSELSFSAHVFPLFPFLCLRPHEPLHLGLRFLEKFFANNRRFTQINKWSGKLVLYFINNIFRLRTFGCFEEKYEK